MKKFYLRRNIALFSLIIWGAVAAFAITPQQLCERVSAKLASNTVEAHFTMNYGGNESKGRILMDKDKFVLVTDYAITWFDGKTQWSYLPSTEEVNVTTPNFEQIQNVNPYYLLSLYKRGYVAKLLRENDRQYVLQLKSTNNKEDIVSVNLTISKKDELPQVFSFVRKNGEEATVKVNSFKLGVQVKKETFIFQPKEYPEAEIIDLR